MKKRIKKPKSPRIRTQVQILNHGIFRGEKFVKKAGMTIKYENYNTVNTPDKQEWL